MLRVKTFGDASQVTEFLKIELEVRDESDKASSSIDLIGNVYKWANTAWLHNMRD
jgi:hypothetical protein